ncbi:TRAP transporter permease [Aliamphritea ceti]|uniref:TRAP transporter permease n=1 Tax=Aliamphritea ceti TaxID=1524258 RepID=UPI0021C43F76|nr:TRAP transporter fused permease subunit [Aliamphritea ceti]
MFSNLTAPDSRYAVWMLRFIALWAFSASVFHLYTAYIGFLEPRTQRSLHLMFMVPLVFLMFPRRRDQVSVDQPFIPGLTGIILFVLAILPFVYSWLEADRINLRLEGIDEVLPVELWMGTIATVLLLEALRRSVSPILAGLVSFGIAYLFLTEYMPGIFNYRDMPYYEIIETLYLFNGQGMFGSITGIAATMVAIFIAYGAFMEASGVGKLFTQGGQLIAGRYSGGPAKVAVVTSAFFGTMSGSASANVFTTGSFTIPMMKRIGFRPQVAGGIETAASVGGQSAPPIMGAGAFIMSEITNTPYSEIIVAAILGSLCFFTLIFVSVHFEARKHGLKGMDASELPSSAEVLKKLYLLIPIVVLIVLLMLRYSPHMSALYSIFATLIVVTFTSERFSPKQLFNVLVTAGRNTVTIAVACAGAGIIVAVLTKTGLVVSIGSIVTDIANGQMWVAAIALMFVTLIMGMGVPTTPAYVITSAIGAPLLINEFGAPVLAAHMFIFYFAILADATPPVSIASYAAASIARCNPLLTGLHASRMAIAGYVVGFSYLFVPEMRMEGSFISIIANLTAIVGGLSLLAAGIAGYFSSRLNVLARLLLISLGVAIALFSWIDVYLRDAAVLGTFLLLYLFSKTQASRTEAIS